MVKNKGYSERLNNPWGLSAKNRKVIPCEIVVRIKNVKNKNLAERMRYSLRKALSDTEGEEVLNWGLKYGRDFVIEVVKKEVSDGKNKQKN